MKKKKLLLGLLLAAGVISLASCAKKPKEKPAETETGGIVIPTETDVTSSETTPVKPTESKPSGPDTPSKKELKVTYKDPETGKTVVLETVDRTITGLPEILDDQKKEFPFILDTSFIGWHVVGTDDEYVDNGTMLKRDIEVEPDFYSELKMDTDLDLSDVTEYTDEIAEIMVLDETYLNGIAKYDDDGGYSYIYKRNETGKFQIVQNSFDSLTIGSSFSSITDDEDMQELSLSEAINKYSDSEGFELLFSRDGFQMTFNQYVDSKNVLYYNLDGYMTKYEYYQMNSSKEYKLLDTEYYTYMFEEPMTDEELEEFVDNASFNPDSIIIEEYDQLNFNKYKFVKSGSNYVASSYTTLTAPTLDLPDVMSYYLEGEYEFFKGTNYVKLYINGGYIIFNLDGSVRTVKTTKKLVNVQYVYDDSGDEEESSYEEFVQTLYDTEKAYYRECSWKQDSATGTFKEFIFSDGVKQEGTLVNIGTDYINHNIYNILAVGTPAVLDFLADHGILNSAVFSKNLNSYYIRSSYDTVDYKFEFDINGMLKFISVVYDGVETTINVDSSIEKYSQVIVRPNIGDNYSESIQAFGTKLEYDFFYDTYDIENQLITRAVYKDFDTFKVLDENRLVDNDKITVLVVYEEIEGVEISVCADYYNPTVPNKTILLQAGKTYGEELKYVNPNVEGFTFAGFYADSEYTTTIDMNEYYSEYDTIYAKYIPLTYKAYTIGTPKNPFNDFTSTTLAPIEQGCIRALGTITKQKTGAIISKDTILELEVTSNAVITLAALTKTEIPYMLLYKVDPSDTSGTLYYINDSGKIAIESSGVVEGRQYYKQIPTKAITQPSVSQTVITSGTKNNTILVVYPEDVTMIAIRIEYALKPIK